MLLPLVLVLKNQNYIGVLLVGLEVVLLAEKGDGKYSL
jgi:hypothetical protein